MTKEVKYLKTIIGTLNITVEDNELISIKYCKNINQQEKNISNSKTMNRVISQLKEYFNKERKIFNIPLKLKSTQFQKDIYKVLSRVEYGKTISYKELAQKSGYKNAQRAVGTALKKNKIALIIPCHRVIKANGKIGNYNGGKGRKEKLLRMEDKY